MDAGWSSILIILTKPAWGEGGRKSSTNAPPGFKVGAWRPRAGMQGYPRCLAPASEARDRQQLRRTKALRHPSLSPGPSTATRVHLNLRRRVRAAELAGAQQNTQLSQQRPVCHPVSASRARARNPQTANRSQAQFAPCSRGWGSRGRAMDRGRASLSRRRQSAEPRATTHNADAAN